MMVSIDRTHLLYTTTLCFAFCSFTLSTRLEAVVMSDAQVLASPDGVIQVVSAGTISSRTAGNERASVSVRSGADRQT